MERQISIYVLIDPSNRDVFYVGQTNNPSYRLSRHLCDTKQRSRHLWKHNQFTKKEARIFEILQRGERPVLRVIERVPVGIGNEREIFWYEALKEIGHPLTNKCRPSNGARWGEHKAAA